MNEEGNIFIFSAESYGTKGVDDIYVSIKKGGKWMEPINLGSSINTSYQEKTPSLGADGKTIYEGPRGGHFYYNDNGNKVYVKKK